MTHATPRQPGDPDFAGNSPSATATKRVGQSQGMKGKTAPLRRTIRLASRYQLQTDPAGKEHTLLSAKGPIQLNETAAGILELCNGKYTAAEIVARVLRNQDNSLAEDIRAFLDAAQRRGWIVHS